MGRIIALTAKSRNGQNFASPRVVYVQEDAISVTPGTDALKGTLVVEKLEDRTTTYRVYETAMAIEAQRNPSSTDILVKQQIALALAGAGTTQGAGTALTKYFNEPTTIGAAATEAFTLPAATVGKVIVIVNNDAAGDAAKVFPAVGEYHYGQAINTVLSIAAGDRIHLVCLEVGVWRIAVDRGK
jgi:hypothetical protein